LDTNLRGVPCEFVPGGFPGDALQLAERGRVPLQEVGDFRHGQGDVRARGGAPWIEAGVRRGEDLRRAARRADIQRKAFYSSIFRVGSP
jgi:hypothetical protein